MNVNQLIRAEQVAAMIGVSRRTLDRMVAAGKFPGPVRFTRGTIGWNQPDLEQYLRERQACAQ